MKALEHYFDYIKNYKNISDQLKEYFDADVWFGSGFPDDMTEIDWRVENETIYWEGDMYEENLLELWRGEDYTLVKIAGYGGVYSIFKNSLEEN